MGSNREIIAHQRKREGDYLHWQLSKLTFCDLSVLTKSKAAREVRYIRAQFIINNERIAFFIEMHM